VQTTLYNSNNSGSKFHSDFRAGEGGSMQRVSPERWYLPSSTRGTSPQNTGIDTSDAALKNHVY
jgi:hypothetical protein